MLERSALPPDKNEQNNPCQFSCVSSCFLHFLTYHPQFLIERVLQMCSFLTMKTTMHSFVCLIVVTLKSYCQHSEILLGENEGGKSGLRVTGANHLFLTSLSRYRGIEKMEDN